MSYIFIIQRLRTLLDEEQATFLSSPVCCFRVLEAEQKTSTRSREKTLIRHAKPENKTPLLSHLGFPCWPDQSSSVAQSCRTLYDPVDCSTPGPPVHHQLPEFTQTPVHWVGNAIQPSTSSVIPFSSYLQSFPASGSFQMNQFFAYGGQSIGVSVGQDGGGHFLFKKLSRIYSELHHLMMRTYLVSLVISGECKLNWQWAYCTTSKRARKIAPWLGKTWNQENSHALLDGMDPTPALVVLVPPLRPASPLLGVNPVETRHQTSLGVQWQRLWASTAGRNGGKPTTNNTTQKGSRSDLVGKSKALHRIQRKLREFSTTKPTL